MITYECSLSFLFVFWVLELPLAWVLSHAGGLEATGVFVALAVSYSMLAVVTAVLFKRGKWKTARV